MQERISIWTAAVFAGASALFHAAHAAAMFAAAGWAAWLGWDVNAITLALCAVLFVSYLRHRKENRRKAASRLLRDRRGDDGVGRLLMCLARIIGSNWGAVYPVFAINEKYR